MKRSTVQRISLAAATLMLAAGCAAGPQRSPAPTVPPTNNVSSTTGVEDACAVALGNAPTTMGTIGITVPGTTGRTTTGVTTPGTTDTTGMTTPGATPGATPGTTPGTTGVTTPGATGTTAATTGTEITANGVIIGNVALVSLPTTEGVMTTPGATAPAGGVTTGARGTTGVVTPGPAPAAPTGSSALDRIRTACTRIVQIRVVTDENDRARLARVTQSIRRGVPVTDLMDDLITVNRKSTVAWTGGPGPAAPGAAGTAPGASGISPTVLPPSGARPPR